jgi:hypothetical protein
MGSTLGGVDADELPAPFDTLDLNRSTRLVVPVSVTAADQPRQSGFEVGAGL